jgi:hypothetical protein
VTAGIDTPPRSNRRRNLGIGAAVLAAGFLAYALISGWSEISSYTWHPNWGLFALSALVILVSYFVTGGAYVAVVESLVEPHPKRRRMLAVWGVSLLGRYVPGSVVMIAGRMEMARPLGVPRRTTLAAMTYEQVLSVGVAAGCGAAFVLLFGHLGPTWVGWLVVFLPLGLVILHPRLIGPASERILRRVGREPLPQVISSKRVLVLAAWYLVAELALGVGAWLGVRAVGGPAVGSVVFITGAFLFAFAISMLVIVVPSGLGIREGAFALALAQHVPGSVAVALAVVSRLEITVVELISVGVFTLIARRR